jgi:hypothetical protein
VTSTTDTVENITVSKFASAARVAGGTSYTDTQTLDIAGAKVTALNLTSTGGTNAFTLTNSASSAPLATITIAGDKALTLTEGLANVKTINASTATGAITLNTTAANAALAFTGGTGNDKISFAAGTLVKTQVLDGGAGTDTLIIKDVAIDGTTLDLNTSVNAAKNFEALGFAGTAVTVDLSKVTAFTQFSVEAAVTGASGVAGATFTGESNSQSITLNAGLTGGAAASGTVAGNAGLVVTPTLDNGSNAFALTLSGVTITGSNGGGTSGNGGSAVDLTSFETVTITSNANAAGTVTANTFTAGTAQAGSTAGSGLLLGANANLTISGAADLNLGSVVSNPGQALNNNLTLNAGSLTGALTAVTGAGNDVITGGAGVNTITLGGGADSVDLSKSVAKADVITVASATGTLKSGIVITGFTDALNTGDTLNLAGTTAVAASGTATANAGLANAVTATINANGLASFTAVGATAALSDYVDAVFGAINATGKAATFVFGSDTYVVQDNVTAGQFTANSDVVVKLVGLTGVVGLSTAASDATHIWVV